MHGRTSLFFSNLKNFLLRTGEAFKIFDYTHPQKYDFFYRVKIENKGSHSQKCTVVLPYPLEQSQQKLLHQPVFDQQVSIKTDKKYGNKYVLWETKLQAHEQKTIEEHFLVEVSPARAVIGLGSSEPFLTSNRFIQADHPEIQKMAREIQNNLVDYSKISPENQSIDRLMLAKKINDFVISYLDYKNPILGLYSSLEALYKKEVDCGGFDTFFATLCIACGIPARVVSGFWADATKSLQPNNKLMHAWAEFQNAGEWIPVDPATEFLFQRRRTNRSGRFGFVGSDRIVFSYGCDISLEINGKEYSTDILQNAFIVPENPDIKVEVFCEVKDFVPVHN